MTDKVVKTEKFSQSICEEGTLARLADLHWPLDGKLRMKQILSADVTLQKLSDSCDWTALLDILGAGEH